MGLALGPIETAAEKHPPLTPQCERVDATVREPSLTVGRQFERHTRTAKDIAIDPRSRQENGELAARWS